MALFKSYPFHFFPIREIVLFINATVENTLFVDVVDYSQPFYNGNHQKAYQSTKYTFNRRAIQLHMLQCFQNGHIENWGNSPIWWKVIQLHLIQHKSYCCFYKWSTLDHQPDNEID